MINISQTQYHSLSVHQAILLIPSSLTSKLSAILIVFASLIAASMEIGAPQWLVLISGFCLAFYLLVEWKQLNLVSRITFFVCVALVAYLVIVQKMSMAILMSAFGRASFFAFFLVSLDLLRDAASSSPLIMRSGQKVIDQPPGRRYAVLTLSTHFFSILLNMGAINLLGTMTRRSIDAGYEKAGERVSQIPLRRMTLAMFRGFCSNTLWAPTSVTVVVVMAAIPDYGWYEFFPVGIILAILFLTVGWVLDRVSYPRSSLIYSGESFGQVLVTGFSPFASANLISSRVIGRTAKEVGMIWNGRFTFGVMALLSGSILLLA